MHFTPLSPQMQPPAGAPPVAGQIAGEHAPSSPALVHVCPFTHHVSSQVQTAFAGDPVGQVGGAGVVRVPVAGVQASSWLHFAPLSPQMHPPAGAPPVAGQTAGKHEPTSPVLTHICPFRHHLSLHVQFVLAGGPVGHSERVAWQVPSALQVCPALHSLPTCHCVVHWQDIPVTLPTAAHLSTHLVGDVLWQYWPLLQVSV